MHTKLHAWALPCDQVAYFDYDGVMLNEPDRVFDDCGGHPMCATQDHVTVKRAGLRLPNGGLLVLRPNHTLHKQLVADAEEESRTKVKRFHIEQGFLNSKFPEWHELQVWRLSQARHSTRARAHQVNPLPLMIYPNRCTGWLQPAKLCAAARGEPSKKHDWGVRSWYYPEDARR